MLTHSLCIYVISCKHPNTAILNYIISLSSNIGPHIFEVRFRDLVFRNILLCSCFSGWFEAAPFNQHINISVPNYMRSIQIEVMSRFPPNKFKAGQF